MDSFKPQLFEGCIELTHNGDVAVVTFVYESPLSLSENGTPLYEHRLNPTTLFALNSALDAALASPRHFRAVMLTGKGKYFCNGVDLKWITAQLLKQKTLRRGFTRYMRSGNGKSLESDVAKALQQEIELLLARILAFPLPTIACINGHACAGGAMLALACDYRVMLDTTSAWFFAPGLDIHSAYSPGLVALVKSKVHPHLYRDVMCFSKRYKVKELLSEKIIDAICPKLKDSEGENGTEADQNELEININHLQNFTFQYIDKNLFMNKDFGGKRFYGKDYRETFQNIKLNTYDEAYFLLTENNIVMNNNVPTRPSGPSEKTLKLQRSMAL